ncbi:30S ribosomal protein S17 [Chitinivibrio alkaliphilus]|uniref:Small ribosomal subunit protein uS17 n=1 Tax=Chitinivibrio alkaliphilus ACht1 TaxID=1313304 RepID=U7D5P9_9BACT|nr:30S ribosomal protein S17 [Chitinivibrio alkaliphilus]ERP31298.1 30S ribosomal protein S17 [Chitinivibrio alkaliphilus ACht1]
MAERNNRKTRNGVVTSAKADKTIVVNVQRQVVHPKYGKMVRLNKKYKAHDEHNTCNEGDTVRIMETRPLSRTKRWRLVEIIEKAQ